MGSTVVYEVVGKKRVPDRGKWFIDGILVEAHLVDRYATKHVQARMHIEKHPENAVLFAKTKGGKR